MHARDPNDNLRKFRRTFETLQRFTSQPVVDDLARAGVVKAFEFTFELAWKSVQEWVIASGFPERGPKASLRTAFRGELIGEEEERLLQAMMNDRNLSAQTYRGDEIERIANAVVQEYLAAFESLLARLEAAEKAA